MLDFRITTFLKVCEYMNFTKAAKELGLSQPAVSKHIRYLEEYYEVRLFEYKNRKLALTPQGRYLKNIMNGLNHDTLRIRGEISEINRKEHISIGATLSVGNFYLHDYLMPFLKKHPEINLSLMIADTEELLRHIDDGSLAFIMCEGNFSKTDYDYMLLKNSYLEAYCCADYDISGIREIKDLFSHRIILREHGSGTRNIFEHFLTEKGFNTGLFKSFYEVNNAEMILKMLKAGMGISVLYCDVAAADLAQGRIKKIPLPDFELKHEFNAIWARGSIHSEEYTQMIKSLFCTD